MAVFEPLLLFVLLWALRAPEVCVVRAAGLSVGVMMMRGLAEAVVGGRIVAVSCDCVVVVVVVVGGGCCAGCGVC